MAKLRNKFLRRKNMLSTKVTLINPLGLHARAATKLVDVTKGFSSSVTLTKDGKSVDAKSIMSVLLLGAPVGTTLSLGVDGEDESAAMQAICDLINAGFHELDDQ